MLGIVTLDVLFPHRNHPKADQRGGTVVRLLAVDADVVAGIEVAAAVCDAPLIDHLRHVATHIVQTVIVGMTRFGWIRKIINIMKRIIVYHYDILSILLGDTFITEP